MKIGADPELFLVGANSALISSIGIIGGTKAFPRAIGREGCAVQEDNVAVEFNITPCADVRAFVECINYNLEYLSSEVSKRNLSLHITPSEVFPDSQLEHPDAKRFGCDPDMNAWTGMLNPPPRSKNPNLRSAGGHIHVGFDGEKLNELEVVKAMDVFLGLSSVTLDPDKRRRELYGKAGACRVKPYGVEYRTLSNFWLKSDELKEWAFNQTTKAVKFIRDGGSFDEDVGRAIQRAINVGDEKLSKALCVEYGV